jgi:uncharacterized phage-associated protein
MLDKDQINKLGNAIIFLAERIDDLSKTKLLKLVYLIDEISVKRRFYPFFNLKYQVWQLGPVNPDLYYDFNNFESRILHNHITKNKNEYFQPIHSFDDEEFSNDELEILEDVVSKYGNWTAKALIEYCHRNNTQWRIVAQETGIFKEFEEKSRNTSDFEINLRNYLQETGKSIYDDYLEFQEFSSALKQLKK